MQAENRTILVVEDDKAIRDCLRELLEMEGFSVCLATHGQEAMELLVSKTVEPHLILLDLTMPIMDGSMFLKAYENLPVALSRAPVFVMTAAAGPGLMLLSSRHKLIRKPIDVDVLLSAIEALPPVFADSVESLG